MVRKSLGSLRMDHDHNNVMYRKEDGVEKDDERERKEDDDDKEEKGRSEREDRTVLSGHLCGGRNQRGKGGQSWIRTEKERDWGFSSLF